jgi:hypothetical protein
MPDKKGKPIYEKDFVVVKGCASTPSGIDLPKEVFKIVWQHDRMRFGLQDKDMVEMEDSWAFTPSNDFEVIGNEFETAPEDLWQIKTKAKKKE